MMEILSMLAEVSIYAVVIFLAILLFRLCFRKSLAPALRYALWFVLIMRLLIPVTIDGGVHLVTQPTAADSPAVTARASGSETPAVTSTQPAADAAQTGGAGAAPAAAEARGALKPTAEQAVVFVWLGGAALCGGWMLASYLLLCGRIRRHAAPPSERLTALFTQTKAELNVRSRVRLACLYEYGAPALVFPNLLWMPVNALVSMDDRQAKDALRHELTHLQRGDHLVNALICALCAIYWFNPVVWICARLMRDDMESACDARVTRNLSHAQKQSYASLVLMLYAQPAHRALTLGLGGRGVRKQAERRVRGVFLRQKSGALARVAALALILLLAFGCFTTACQPAENTAGRAMNAENPWPSDVPEEKIARLDWEAREIAEGVTLEIHADVTAPKDAKTPIALVERTSFDYGAFTAILEGLAPGAEWTITSNAEQTGLNASGEQNGVTYTARAGTFAGDGASCFSYGVADIYIIREGYFVNDPEIEQDYGKEIRKPIELAAAEARIHAEAALGALGASGLLLQSAERTCWFEEANGRREVVSRGWTFVYVPDNGGLPVYYRGGRSGISRIYGEELYGEPIREMLSIYVDEAGVRHIDWRDACAQSAVLEQNAAILPYETILEHATERLAERYARSYAQSGIPLALAVTKMQLAAIIASDEKVNEAEAMYHFAGGAVSSGRLIPVWELLVTVAEAGKEPYETVVFPFSAIDATPLLQQQ